MKNAVAALCMALVMATAWAVAEEGPRIGPDKKIIHYFQYWPDANYCRENVREMERLPFDGIAIWPTAEIDGKREKLWFRWFNPERISEDLVADTIRDLKATDFRKFTDNFLQMSSQNGPLALPGWWDDTAWEKITANLALAARIAKECNLKGIMIDVEQYGPAEKWRFHYLGSHAEEEKLFEQKLIDRMHTWQEFADAARRRGRDIMTAMCEVYPDITVMSIAGFHDLSRRATDAWERDGLPASYYALLAPFADGLIEGAGTEATIIDGAEGAYDYTLNRRFVERRASIENAFDLSAVPELYKDRMSIAFGLMLDYGFHSRGWHTDPKDLHRNHFTPVDFGTALYFAMLNSDRYVWVYSELDGAVFLEDVYGYWQDPKEHARPTVPEEYLLEMNRAREPRDLATGRDHSAIRKMPLPASASELPGYGAQETFAPLLGEFEMIADLPEEWLFYADEEALGEARQGFADIEIDLADWKPIRIGEYLQLQGHRFRGVGWYRCSFRVPKDLEGKHVFLLFPGVSPMSPPHIYVNGGWCDGEVKNGVLIVNFTPNITPHVARGGARFGRENVVVVPILADGNPGGIYKKPVKLAVLKSEEKAK